MPFVKLSHTASIRNEIFRSIHDLERLQLAQRSKKINIFPLLDCSINYTDFFDISDLAHPNPLLKQNVLRRTGLVDLHTTSQSTSSGRHRGAGRSIIGGTHIHIFVFTDCKNN